MNSVINGSFISALSDCTFSSAVVWKNSSLPFLWQLCSLQSSLMHLTERRAEDLPVDVPVTGSGGQPFDLCLTTSEWGAAETNWGKNVSRTVCVPDLQSLAVFCNTACGKQIQAKAAFCFGGIWASPWSAGQDTRDHRDVGCFFFPRTRVGRCIIVAFKLGCVRVVWLMPNFVNGSSKKKLAALTISSSIE